MQVRTSFERIDRALTAVRSASIQLALVINGRSFQLYDVDFNFLGKQVGGSYCIGAILYSATGDPDRKSVV